MQDYENKHFFRIGLTCNDKSFTIRPDADCKNIFLDRFSGYSTAQHCSKIFFVMHLLKPAQVILLEHLISQNQAKNHQIDARTLKNDFASEICFYDG